MMDTPAEHLDRLEEWAENANEQLNTITTKLQEMEILLERFDGDDVNLFEFLRNVEYIKQKHQQVVTKVLSTKGELADMQQELELQMKILESTLQLMEIESESS